MRTEEFKYQPAFLDRHWPKDRAGMLYAPPPLPWRMHLRRDHNERIIVDAANVEAALLECPDLAGLIWWEAMEKRCYVVGRMPDEDVFSMDEFRPMTHDDVTAIQLFVQREAMQAGIDRRTVYFVIRRVAQTYHPFLSRWFYDEDGQ